LGYAGLRGLKDYRKTPDIFGRLFHFSRVDAVDSLATAAVLCMGEGRERQPLAVISGAPVEYTERVVKNELRIDIREDMYGPLFRQFK
jgi:F420-0:gamma-glutamyl ligase